MTGQPESRAVESFSIMMPSISDPSSRGRARRRVVPGVLVLLLCAAWLPTALAQPPAPRPDKQKDKANERPSPNRVVVDRVVAVVNDHVILQSELETNVLPLAVELSSISDARERERRRSKLTSQVLEQMINDELIVQAAQDAQLKVESKEITAALDEIKKQNNLDDAGLEQALAMQGYSIASYKKEVERQLLRLRATSVLVRPRVSVTDEDVRARYDEMNRRSGAIGKVYLKHILIGLPESPSDQELASAKAKAAEIIDQAKAGVDFSELAQKHSDDPATAMGGGDLGWIERGSLATEWETVIFSMEKGEVRGPITGPTGLHVFYIGDVEKTDIQPFDKVESQLRNELMRQEMDKQTVLWLEELRKKAFIENKLEDA